jgi:hypothetical protein
LEAHESELNQQDNRSPHVVDMISIDDPDDDVIVVDATREFGYHYPESLDLVQSNSASTGLFISFFNSSYFIL